MLDAQLESLNDAVTRVAQEYPNVPLLMTQPGIGAVTALAFVLTLGDVHRFPRGKQVASYLGLVPSEHSSGGKQRMGGISKQGNRLLRFLLVEAANIAVRFDPELRKNICTAAITNTSPSPRWRRLVSLRYGCIGCFVHRHCIHRFFHRG
ncbi:transposase [Tunturiibacter lichenicola]|uniref:transposase n=1 Tax=Tunturiibacter lichenicola TaxID=2051959 RepID=UPI003D9B538F